MGILKLFNEKNEEVTETAVIISKIINRDERDIMENQVFFSDGRRILVLNLVHQILTGLSIDLAQLNIFFYEGYQAIEALSQ